MMRMNLFSRRPILWFSTQDKMYRSYGTQYAGLIMYNGLKPIVTTWFDPTGLDSTIKITADANVNQCRRHDTFCSVGF